MKRFSTCLLALVALSLFAAPDLCHAKKKKKPKKSARVSQPTPAISNEPPTSVVPREVPISPPPAVSPHQDRVQQALTALNAYAKLQGDLQIQSIESAVALRKAIAIADLLISSHGALELDLRPRIKSLFIPSQPQDWEAQMGRVLDELDSSWEPFFASIKSPIDVRDFNTVALRALLSLDPFTSLTDRHVQVAVLAAMLIGNDQAFAEDYRSIAMRGFIERSIDGNSEYYFFLPTLSDSDREKSFTLTASGAFAQGQYALFDAPGFAAARALMGANDMPNLSQEILQILSASRGEGQIETTASQVIHAMAQAVAGRLCNASVDDLYALGKYGFSALTSHPILKGVEAALIAIAEDQSENSVRSQINTSLFQALDTSWKQLKRLKALPQFQQAFAKAWDQSYRLVYSFDIASSSEAVSSEGFQLYQRILGEPERIGNKVETPRQLSDLLKQTVVDAEAQLGDIANVNKIGDRLIKVTGSDPFLKNFFQLYDVESMQESDPVLNYRKLSRTPMQSSVRSSSFEAIESEESFSVN